VALKRTVNKWHAAHIEVHVEDLAAHIAGRERATEARWGELLPSYQNLAADID